MKNNQPTEKMYLEPFTKDRFITKTEYFKLLFGDEYMNSVDKGRVKEY